MKTKLELYKFLNHYLFKTSERLVIMFYIYFIYFLFILFYFIFIMYYFINAG